jgi:magnesium transporter
MWKEIRVSVLCGVSLAVACFFKIVILDGAVLHTAGVDKLVALVVALTLCATVICAKIIGCVLPIVAKMLKLDPAVMASPFITTIVDAVSLLVYFGVAKSLIPALG